MSLLQCKDHCKSNMRNCNQQCLFWNVSVDNRRLRGDAGCPEVGKVNVDV